MEKQKLWVLLAVMGLTAGITACSGQEGAEPASSSAEENKTEEETVTEAEEEAGSPGAVVDAAIRSTSELSDHRSGGHLAEQRERKAGTNHCRLRQIKKGSQARKGGSRHRSVVM